MINTSIDINKKQINENSLVTIQKKIHIDELPSEMIKHIFSFLNISDLRVIENVCRKWNLISQEESLYLSKLSFLSNTIRKLSNQIFFKAWLIMSTTNENVEEIKNIIIRSPLDIHHFLKTKMSNYDYYMKVSLLQFGNQTNNQSESGSEFTKNTRDRSIQVLQMCIQYENHRTNFEKFSRGMAITAEDLDQEHKSKVSLNENCGIRDISSLLMIPHTHANTTTNKKDFKRKRQVSVSQGAFDLLNRVNLSRIYEAKSYRELRDLNQLFLGGLNILCIINKSLIHPTLDFKFKVLTAINYLGCVASTLNINFPNKNIPSSQIINIHTVFNKSLEITNRTNMCLINYGENQTADSIANYWKQFIYNCFNFFQPNVFQDIAMKVTNFSLFNTCLYSNIDDLFIQTMRSNNFFKQEVNLNSRIYRFILYVTNNFSTINKIRERPLLNDFNSRLNFVVQLVFPSLLIHNRLMRNDQNNLIKTRENDEQKVYELGHEYYCQKIAKILLTSPDVHQNLDTLFNFCLSQIDFYPSFVFEVLASPLFKAKINEFKDQHAFKQLILKNAVLTMYCESFQRFIANYAIVSNEDLLTICNEIEIYSFNTRQEEEMLKKSIKYFFDQDNKKIKNPSIYSKFVHFANLYEMAYIRPVIYRNIVKNQKKFTDLELLFMINSMIDHDRKNCWKFLPDFIKIQLSEDQLMDVIERCWETTPKQEKDLDLQKYMKAKNFPIKNPDFIKKLNALIEAQVTKNSSNKKLQNKKRKLQEQAEDTFLNPQKKSKPNED